MANLSPEQMRAAIPLLEQRVADLQELNVSQISRGDDFRVIALQARIEQTVARIYGPDTHEYTQLSPAWELDMNLYAMGYDLSASEIREGVREGQQRAMVLLTEAAHSLGEALQHMPGTPPAPDQAAAVVGKDVFVVHGHDGQAKAELQLFLQRAGLNPVVLHEQPNNGRTVIEKFEAVAGAVGFAVALMTADDEGGPVGGPKKPRARQNVVGELFWFAGKLGRKHVCALRKGDVEIPSDLAGIVYTDMDDRGAWRSELLKELQAAGYKVDWQKALG